MTTRVDMFVLGPDQLDDAARSIARRWAWFLVGGIVVTGIGLLLLFNLVEAAHTLALLIALALMIQGVDEIMNASRYRPKWPAYLLGGLLIVLSIWAAVWPDITLWALAALTGVGFLVVGMTELVAVLRHHHDLPHRGWFVALAVVTIVTGLMALVWPKATITVLALLLGLRVFVQGMSLIAFSFGLRKVNATAA